MNYTESTSALPQKLKINKGSKLYLKAGVYTVENEIGKGGFGIVYNVRSDNSNELFALKVLALWEVHPDEYSPLSKRFNLEYKIGKTVAKNLVEAYHFGFMEGNPYIIMELCPNGNLSNDKYKYQNEAALLDLIYNILNGLEELHKNGIIHRDIKPENILYSKDNIIKISDFGISANINLRLTTTNLFGIAKERFGSVLFSAPETFKASKYFKYTMPTMDIYALGVTLYYLASGGHYPIGSFEEYEKSPTTYVKKKNKGEHIPLKSYSPHLSRKTIKFIEKCFRPKISDRFQNIKEARKYIGIKNNMNCISSKFEPKSDSKYNSIIVEFGENVGHKYNLDEIIEKKEKNIISIGRFNDSNIINDIDIKEIQSQYISKKHCTIEKIGEDWYIRDGQFVFSENIWTNSLNGLMVDNIFITNGDSKLIIDGSIIKIGETIMKFNTKK